jgi:HEAT repeat protein
MILWPASAPKVAAVPEQEQAPNPQRKIFFGLFVFPLLIAVGMAILLCSVVFLTSEEETPESLLAAIKTGSPSKRWQKAFELSNELNRGSASIRTEGAMKEIVHILEDREHYDARTRGYMALALAHFRQEGARRALREALTDPEEDVKIYSMWSLGEVGARETVPDILPYLGSESSQIRKTAAYVLGVLAGPEEAPALRPLLGDSVADVRWNAALSLARLGNPSGWDVLVKMLERETLAREHRLTEGEIEQVMTNAVKGLALIGKAESLPVLEDLAENDKSLKVRQAAIEAVAYQRGEREELSA